MMRILKTIIFHLLMVFRKPILLLCKILSGMFILGFLLSIFVEEFPFMMKFMWLSFGVGFSVISWYYDSLILLLKPDEVELLLMR